MNQKIKIHTRLLLAQAGSYDNVEKSIAEFVDNSLDSAEELRDDSLNYKRPIKIEVDFQGSTKKTSQITIKDNCVGMDREELVRICTEVGNSKKKNQSFSNGQFGFGIFSFSEFFEEITIQSKNEESTYANQVTISKSSLENNKEIKFEKINKLTFNNSNSGTIIILREYSKRNWKNVNKDKLVKFLSQHFERLLGSKGLEIVIRDKNGQEILTPHNYDNFDGVSLVEKSDSLPKMELYKVKKGQANALIGGSTVENMECYIKVVKSRNLAEKPFFIAIKGRRIGNVKDAISNTKLLDMAIWSSPYLTGYFDLGSFAQPDISRTKIKAGDSKKSIIEYLKRKEKDIKELLDDRNKLNEDKSWNDTASKINDILKDMTKEYNVYFSELSGSKGDEPGSGGNEGGARIRKGDKKIKVKKKVPTNGQGDGDGTGGTGDQGDNDFSDDISKPKKSNLQIQFTGLKTNYKTNPRTGEPYEVASDLTADGKLIFWTQHPDFQERVKVRKGGKFITQRLATFLGTRIAVHFLDKYFQKGSRNIDYSIYQLEDNGNFILKFEDHMQSLIRKNINSIGKDES